MRLTILQSTLHWENPAANRTMFTEKLQSLAGATDLVVLPEMFTTGFSMNAVQLAEPMSGPTLEWMAGQAGALQAVVTGSFICSENGRFYNRLVWMQPDGQYQTYDKRHLFTLAGEREHYTAGSQRLLVEWMGWKICPLICYDLRFPVWIRQRPEERYDLLLFMANWPTRRAHHWRSLLTARAIENQCWLAGVNIVGVDGAGLEYQGDSAVIDFNGMEVCRISGQAGQFTAQLDLEALREYRSRLAFLEDADKFRVE